MKLINIYNSVKLKEIDIYKANNKCLKRIFEINDLILNNKKISNFKIKKYLKEIIKAFIPMMQDYDSYIQAVQEVYELTSKENNLDKIIASSTETLDWYSSFVLHVFILILLKNRKVKIDF